MTNGVQAVCKGPGEGPTPLKSLKKSAVERCLDMVEVTGSTPVGPTSLKLKKLSFYRRYEAHSVSRKRLDSLSSDFRFNAMPSKKRCASGVQGGCV
jgi:hypothetical protein